MNKIITYKIEFDELEFKELINLYKGKTTLINKIERKFTYDDKVISFSMEFNKNKEIGVLYPAYCTDIVIGTIVKGSFNEKISTKVSSITELYSKVYNFKIGKTNIYLVVYPKNISLNSSKTRLTDLIFDYRSKISLITEGCMEQCFFNSDRLKNTIKGLLYSSDFRDIDLINFVYIYLNCINIYDDLRNDEELTNLIKDKFFYYGYDQNTIFKNVTTSFDRNLFISFMENFIDVIYYEKNVNEHILYSYDKLIKSLFF